ncbi:hypothetical protein [Citricoccus muralis]|uniref:PknH-like protein n=1 Tax=Citricoccus muralis TaxID=169134 RepID=A0ABY8H5Z5_9MICC|nr:hypothetical protein [Citricoccus muralis]WFP16077.1 hypothetical protein P8192_11860 [Citricoccus muralis]
MIRTLQLTAALGVTALVLTGCGAGDDTDPDADASASALELPGGHPEVDTTETDEEADHGDASEGPGEVAASPSGRVDQQASSAAAAHAAELGFTEQRAASQAEIDTFRQQAQSRAVNQSGTRITPAECTAPLAALDWSPLLTTSEYASRVDFSSETFDGTGTVEVAAVAEDVGGGAEAADQVQNYIDIVGELTTDCAELTMRISDTTVPEGYEESASYRFTAESVEDEEGTGLIWQRIPETTGSGSGAGDERTALVLVREEGGYVAMVSFVGPEQVRDAEFQQIADQVLTSALSMIPDAE